MSTPLKQWREAQPAPKNRRHRAGVRNPYLSQTEAARYFRVHVSTYRAWESGKRELPPAVKAEVTR